MNLQELNRAYCQQAKERDTRVFAGQEEPPLCFTCGAPSTHITDGITPAGYRAYQCSKHAHSNPLWGSDPGWVNRYIELPVQV